VPVIHISVLTDILKAESAVQNSGFGSHRYREDAITHIVNCRNLVARETVKVTAQETFKCNQFSMANNDDQPKFGGL